MNIKSLEGIDIRQIHAAFKDAFSDYAEAWNKTVDELRQLIERRGYDPSLSFGAFDNGSLVSFTLNGVGNWKGHLTAYDTGTGTVLAYRKQGLAARIFNDSVPVLKQNGVSQYLLEVIKVNTTAFELYQKQGFEVTRELDYYIGIREQLTTEKNNDTVVIKPLAEPDWDVLKQFWEFEPSWQNSIDSINRKRSSFIVLGAFIDDDTLAGYGIIEPSTGDIAQLAIDKQHRRRGVATTLIEHMLNYSSSSLVKFINADTSYAPFKLFMDGIGLKPGHGQNEMIRNL